MFSSLARAGSRLLRTSTRLVQQPVSLTRPVSLARHIATIPNPAPAFSCQAVVDGQFKQVSLSDFAGKYVVLFFYPLDFTFVCPTEITAFSDRAEEFEGLGCQLLACSVDSHFSHLAWNKQSRKEGGLGEMKIPLLSDLNKTISKDYGVLLDPVGISLRGLFIIDPSGNVRHITINDLPIGRSVDETLRTLKALQFFEENGEVCPANWTPGASTIKPGVDESKEYFESEN